MKKQRGITLIALVITIIVLLILAGVSINMITGEDGIIERASQASEKTEASTSEETEELKNSADYIDKYTGNFPDSEDVTANIADYVVVDPCANTNFVDLFGDVTYSTFVTNKGYYPVTVLGAEVNGGAIVKFYAKTSGGDYEEIEFYSWVNNNVYEDAITSSSLAGSYTNFVLKLEKNKDYTIKVEFEESNGAVKYCTYGTNVVTFSYKNSNGTATTSVATVVTGSGVAISDKPQPETYTDGSYTYTFNKWVTTSGGETEADLTSITTNKTVYAKYDEEYEESVCFVAGTKVLTENGLVNIEEVKVGMKVYSYNETTGEVELKTVKQTFINPADKDMTKVTVNGEVIESTSGHEYYEVNKGWTSAKDLQKGDVVLNSNNEEVVVEKVETTVFTGTELNTVYNMEVEDNHNYYVGENNILVHNTGSPC